MTKTRALVRQWTLLRVLSQHADGLTICEMAHHTSVNQRTIRRDLKLFVEAGIPLRERVVRQNKKIWRIDYRGAMLKAGFSAEDALALAIAEHYLAALKGTHFHRALASCRMNIVANLSVNQQKRLSKKVTRLAATTSADTLPSLCAHSIDDLWEGLGKETIADRVDEVESAHVESAH